MREGVGLLHHQFFVLMSFLPRHHPIVEADLRGSMDYDGEANRLLPLKYGLKEWNILKEILC
jgi:hypothetical protein